MGLCGEREYDEMPAFVGEVNVDKLRNRIAILKRRYEQAKHDMRVIEDEGREIEDILKIARRRWERTR